MSNPVYAPNAVTLFNSAVNGFEDFVAGSVSSGPVDLSASTDVLLTATVPAGALSGTTPAITVQLDGLDPVGNVIPAMVKTAAVTAAGTYTVSGGLHSSGLVLPAKGQLTVTMTGASASAVGIEISVTGR